MRIKRLDLCGFKSFCDRVTLDLRQPVTSVVGPNGCGKSNIVDALRWAMGEQSAKHLRGKSMEDVIFNGSDSRGPSGMAEISITFENDGRVPVEYLDYSEITVTRRLYRDGNSEYEINKLPVRLKDITNLFLGTGVGTKAYSIIEQGRVGLIVSSKPEDRRQLVEEAAGITKYRKRKEAAERKMDSTRQNLLRVTDVIEEIDKQLGVLRRQAKKAERYKAYKAEMQDIELWVSAHRMLECIAEEKVLSCALVDAEQKREQIDTDVLTREADIEILRLTAGEHERTIQVLQEELYQLDNQIKLSENAIQFHGQEIDQLERRSIESRSEADSLAQQQEMTAEQYAFAQEQLVVLQRQRDELAVVLSATQHEYDAVRAVCAEVEKALETERIDLSNAERDFARAEASLAAMTTRRRDLSERLFQRRQESDKFSDQLDALQTSSVELDEQLGLLRRKLQDVQFQRQDTKDRLQELSQLVERGEAELEVLRTELHRRKSRLTSLEEIQARYEGYGRGTRAVMQNMNGTAQERGVLGLVADVLEAPAAYETALEAVLGHRLGTIIVEDHQIGVDAISYLKSSAEGRTSFIARSGKKTGVLAEAPVGFVWDSKSQSHGAAQMDAGGGVSFSGAGVHGPMMMLVDCKQDFGPVAQSLLGDVMVVDNLDHALTVWDQLPEKTIVTLEGEILSPDGTVTGGSTDAEVSGVLQQKREIRELSDIIEALDKEYQTTLDRHLSVKTEIASLEEQLELLTRDSHEGDKDVLMREKDLGRIDSETQGLLNRQQEVQRDIEQLTDAVANLDREEHSARELMLIAEETQRLSRDIGTLLFAERYRLNEQLEAAGQAATEGKVKLAQADASLSSTQETVRRLETLQQEQLQRMQRLRQGADDDVSRVEQLRSTVETLRAEVEVQIQQRAVCQEKLIMARTTYEEHQSNVLDCELALKQLRSRQGELGAEIGKLQIKQNELVMRTTRLTDQMFERYRIELAKVLCDYHLHPLAGPEQLVRVDELRQVIERMGEINLMAIEEYEQLNSRFEFLTSHKVDLETALESLQAAIQKINKTCRDRFVETFELVNAKFQEVFPRLFNGGKAKLVLTDEHNDVLQAGVEIIAQPPGKKLQSLDMMSGGEKALTAVSLIFAMFLVKPTPFCLLDEVDAPLDEANVIRFKDLIGEMSAISQFIVITHNRRTMEVADRLYGVTMEEPGISKLVSVNLTEAQAEAA